MTILRKHTHTHTQINTFAETFFYRSVAKKTQLTKQSQGYFMVTQTENMF